MNLKKTLVLSIILLAVGTIVFAAYGKYMKPKEVNVSALTSNPQDYLGKVLITGKSGKILADRGVIEMLDDKACCKLFLLVPRTAEQGRGLGMTQLYTWEQISEGQILTATAKVSKEGENFILEVDEVESAGKTLVKKL